MERGKEGERHRGGEKEAEAKEGGSGGRGEGDEEKRVREAHKKNR